MGSLTDNDDHKTDLSFQAERGIGQGESASSNLMWIALCDMFNYFLHTLEKESIYSEDNILKARMAAYGDGQKRALMQSLLAKWLSTFCTFTGMVLHPNKIKPTIVPILPEIKAYKYLAVHLDLRNKSIHAFNKRLHIASPPWIADHQD